MPFIDSHCHFDFAAFDADRDQVWRRCRKLGVNTILIPGIAPDHWKKAKAICERLQGAYYSVGLHPWWLSSVLQKENSEKVLSEFELAIEAHISSSRCLAIGECGLDAANGPPMELQELALKTHLDWCEKHNLPVILHCYKSHETLLRLLKARRLVRGGVIHAFSGSPEIAMEYVKLGFCLGAGGVITYARANKTRRAFATLPAEAYLLETDAPDMPLQGQQGRRNSPENLPRVADALAQLRGESLQSIEQNSSNNFARVFLNA